MELNEAWACFTSLGMPQSTSGEGERQGEQGPQRHPEPLAGRGSERPLPDWQCFPT